MKVIGLTGGIGTGKTTVSQYLSGKGIPVIDADKIAHEITEKGSETLKKIRNIFGGSVFNEDGSLNREGLGKVVFSDPEKLNKLEEITTKEVIKRCDSLIEEYRNSGDIPMIVLDAPLLFECGMQDRTDENWLVTADLNVRIERIFLRDGLSKEDILDRINNQMPTSEKIKLSDYVIDNSRDLQQLFSRIDSLLERINKENE